MLVFVFVVSALPSHWLAWHEHLGHRSCSAAGSFLSRAITKTSLRCGCCAPQVMQGAGVLQCLKTTFPRAMSRTSARRGECRGGEQLKRLRTCHGAAGRGRALVTSSWRPQSKSDLMILNWITRTSTSTRPHSAAGWDLLRVDRHGRHNARGIRLFKYLRAPTVAGAGELAAVTGGELQNFAGRQKSNYTKISNFPFIGDCRCRHHRR